MAVSCMKQPEDIRSEFVRHWVRKAEDDLETARHLLAKRADLGFSIGFHAQQAAEKYVKAVLVCHQVEFPKSHDLERLAELVSNTNSVFATVVRAATELTTYAVEARYPSELPEPTVAEVNRAFALAETIRDAAKRILPPDSW